MNSDEKEDCECATPQAQTSPTRGPDRWGRSQERVGDAGAVSRKHRTDSCLAADVHNCGECRLSALLMVGLVGICRIMMIF